MVKLPDPSRNLQLKWDSSLATVHQLKIQRDPYGQ